jgi:hypothetical protein
LIFSIPDGTARTHTPRHTEGKEEKRPQKKSKAAASTEVKKEEKKVSALATSAGRIIELNSDTEMDEDLDVWAVEE